MFYSEYDKGKISYCQKSNTFSWEKKSYKGSVHIVLIYPYEIVQFYSFVVRSDMFSKAAAAAPTRACAERQTGNPAATPFSPNVKIYETYPRNISPYF
jgi:hypothetical protein